MLSTKEKIEQWIVDNFATLKCEAEAQVRQHGRGAIVVDWTTREATLSYRLEGYPDENADVKRAVSNYSPTSQMVIVFRQPYGEDVDCIDTYVVPFEQRCSTSVQ
jgi:hypothetical protein